MNLLLAARVCQTPARALSDSEIDMYVRAEPGWALHEKSIRKTFRFNDHYHVMAFLNAVAWISHKSNHHAAIELGYNQCTLTYTTHDAKGLTENDFICAAKVDVLLAI